MALAAAILGGCLPLGAQATRVQDLGIGKLLVAPRDTRDPAFAESVILLVRYDREGTLGLMLNRRTRIPLSQALRDSKGASGRADPVYMGGPVDLENVLALLRAHTMPEGAAHVVGKVYLVSTRALLEKALLDRTPEKTAPGQSDPEALHVYLGYCGWGPGQLENEAGHGLWHVFPGSADVVFDSEPGSLWSRLVARAEQNIARARVQERPGLDGGSSPFTSGAALAMPYISLSRQLFR
jgi:putative transcriptional regulator